MANKDSLQLENLTSFMVVASQDTRTKIVKYLTEEKVNFVWFQRILHHDDIPDEVGDALASAIEDVIEKRIVQTKGGNAVRQSILARENWDDCVKDFLERKTRKQKSSDPDVLALDEDVACIRAELLLIKAAETVALCDGDGIVAQVNSFLAKPRWSRIGLVKRMGYTTTRVMSNPPTLEAPKSWGLIQDQHKWTAGTKGKDFLYQITGIDESVVPPKEEGDKEDPETALAYLYRKFITESPRLSKPICLPPEKDPSKAGKKTKKSKDAQPTDVVSTVTNTTRKEDVEGGTPVGFRGQS